MNIDPVMVTAILTAVGGIGVIGIIQTLKAILSKWMDISGWKAILLALIVSFAATGLYLWQAQTFSLAALIIYGALVFGEASGLYKVIKKT